MIAGLAALVGSLGLSLAAQAAPAPAALALSTPTPAETPEGAPDYTIGAGDVLEIEVFGNDDLSRTATVQTNGTISLPLLGDLVVAGLSIREAAARLTELLGRDYLVNPQVEVRIKDYLSQYVTVVGEVQTPGRKPLKGRTRLIDALVEAGGVNSRASGEVILTRTSGVFPDGSRTLSVRLGGALTPDNEALLQTVLKNGDVVTASPRQFVVVEGEVQKPNRYAVDGDLTVTAAISLAGGLTRFGSSDVKIRRVNPATGKTEILEASLKAIRKGKQADVALLPNDTVTVSRRIF
jgi:polysaccharide export outer membrane protein